MNDHARVLFFATLRDKTGVKEISIEIPTGSTIADVKALMLQQFPALEPLKDMMIVALNHQFAFDNDIVPEGAEIAMFPPVSGGEGNQSTHPTIVAITDHDIDLNTIVAQITLPTTGAVCTFTGAVRGVTSRGLTHETKYLEYEAYRVMAEEKLWQICTEIRARWNEVEGIALVQRIGLINPGVVSVVVACSASHRDMGIFEAAHYGIDRLKEIVPVWKKEVSTQGEQWVEGEYFPHRGE